MCKRERLVPLNGLSSRHVFNSWAERARPSAGTPWAWNYAVGTPWPAVTPV